MPKLANFVQKTILISIPGLTKDDRLYPYKLVGIEADGLWIESPSLRSRLQSPPGGTDHGELAAFVPFAQILYVLCDAFVELDTNRRVLVSHLREAPRGSKPPEPDRNRKRNSRK